MDVQTVFTAVVIRAPDGFAQGVIGHDVAPILGQLAQQSQFGGGQGQGGTVRKLDQRIVELDVVEQLVSAGAIVITVGGGGIPVVRKDGKLYGTPAVIDKDFASAKLAELLDADMLVILTAVEKVAINFGKPDQKGLDDLTPADARKYIEEKQFAPGSMLPKVQAALSFAESKPGRVALITLLEKAADGISGKTGTRVHQ